MQVCFLYVYFTSSCAWWHILWVTSATIDGSGCYCQALLEVGRFHDTFLMKVCFIPPPASKYASIQCAIYCLIWLPSLQHVCPGAGEIGNKSFACISCLFDPAALFCLMKLDFNSKCHSQSWQSLLFWSITRVLSEKHSGFSDYFSKKKKKKYCCYA